MTKQKNHHGVRTVFWHHEEIYAIESCESEVGRRPRTQETRARPR